MKRSQQLMAVVGIAMAVAVPLAVHAQQRVIGKTPVKMKYSAPLACQGQSSVTGTTSRSNRGQAEADAIALWTSTYGANSYGNWGLAQNKAMSCQAGSGGWLCTASGVPCTPIRNAL